MRLSSTAAGYYGKTVAPVDPNVLDKIMLSATRQGSARPNRRSSPTLEDLQKRYGHRR